MVKLITKTPLLKAERASEMGNVGFVPTMGNLHAGHISLLEEALKAHPIVYFSIFVNPKQFGPNEDFHKYPRTLENDIALITDCEKKYPGKKIVVFSPEDPQEVFPHDLNDQLSVQSLSTVIEGALRPGHFDGVATVVYRLFELVKPTTAYFGLKDYQQYLVIRQMVKDLIIPVEIIGMPIIRDESGLALSSRNQYLTTEQKKEALILSQTLKRIGSLIDNKRVNLDGAKKEIEIILKDTKWNYIEMRDAESLSEDVSKSKSLTLLGVYQLGTTRLLDNMQMEIQ
jgi:pantoate--beta-alanine ligase